MSYVPTNWSNGDLITAEKLNKIEQGIADNSDNSDNSVTWVTVSSSGSTISVDKTPAEIFAACSNGLVFARHLDYNNVPDGRIGYVFSVSETHCVIMFPATDIETGFEFGPFDLYEYSDYESRWLYQGYRFKMVALD